MNPIHELSLHGVVLPYIRGLYDETIRDDIAYGPEVKIAQLVEILNYAEKGSLADLKAAHDMMIGEICPDG